MLLHVVRIGLAADRFDHQPEGVVVAVRVLEHTTRRRRELHHREIADATLDAGDRCSKRSAGRQTAGLVEKLADGDLAAEGRIRDPKPRQVVLDGCIEVQGASLLELHDPEGGEGLALGSEDEGRVSRHGRVAAARGSKPFDVGDPITVNDAECEAGCSSQTARREAVSSCQGRPWTCTEVRGRPILYSKWWCRGTGSNCRHQVFQTCALPTELPRRSATQCSGPPLASHGVFGSRERPYNRSMARVIHVRVRGVAAADRDRLQNRFTELISGREWRDQLPWLADAGSTDLFDQLFFEQALTADLRDDPPRTDLSAAGFIRVAGDETDALALVFVLRDLSERFTCRVGVRDPDNPIAKLRVVDLVNGRLADQRALESILVRRPIFKRMRDGNRIEMYPPRALGSAFGTMDGADGERRAWSFLVHGMRDSRPNFLEAEAEAMRMWRGLRFLE